MKLKVGLLALWLFFDLRLISLDVNLRYSIFASKTELLNLAREAASRAHIVKATVEEASALYGDADEAELLARMHGAGPDLILLTRGEHGAIISTPYARLSVKSPKTRVIDSTGAGDASMGMLLAQVAFADATPKDLHTLSKDTLQEWGTAACRAGANCIVEIGATTAMCRELKD